MNLVSQRSKSFVVLLATLVALPLTAATRRRAATPPAPAQKAIISVKGVVTDAQTGQPVVNAEISSAVSNVKVLSDASGKFEIHVNGGAPVALTAARTGYTSATQTVNSKTDTSITFSLTPTATTTVKEANGNVTQIDTESFKFAYLVPFSGYASSDTANFCVSDGTTINPTRQDLVKLIGPATPQNFAPCCKLGPVLSMQAVFRDGTTRTVYLTDSCFGNETDVLGRVHSTGVYAYFNLANVAEVDLP